jgi:alpha-tubulin suppressor-like RCC1 family protein
LNSVVEIAGGTYASLALQNNGTVVAWGANFANQTNVPREPQQRGVHREREVSTAWRSGTTARSQLG